MTVAPLPTTAASERSGRRARSSRTHELTWRLVRDEPRPAAENMALDHALAARLAEGAGVVRLYGWSRPTVSFGKNEPAAPTAGADVDYVRRPTGGRAVLHDDELTYAVVAPTDAFGGLREAYRSIHEALAAALTALGAEVRLAGDAGGSPPPDAGPCFGAPAAGELVAAGRKLVGSAQARLDGALLQHGSILMAGSQGPLGSESVGLVELVGDVGRDDVAEAVAGALERRLRGRWNEGVYDARELEAARRLEAERYGNDTWTWRRRQEST